MREIKVEKKGDKLTIEGLDSFDTESVLAFLHCVKLKNKWQAQDSHTERVKTAHMGTSDLAFLYSRVFQWCLDTSYIDALSVQTGIEPEAFMYVREDNGNLTEHRTLGRSNENTDCLGEQKIWDSTISYKAQRAAMLDVLSKTRFAVPRLCASQLGYAFTLAENGPTAGLLSDLRDDSIQRITKSEKKAKERLYQSAIVCGVHYLTGLGLTANQARKYWANFFLDENSSIDAKTLHRWETDYLPTRFGFGPNGFSRRLKHFAELGKQASAIKGISIEKRLREQKRSDNSAIAAGIYFYDTAIEYRRFLKLDHTGHELPKFDTSKSSIAAMLSIPGYK